MRRRARAVYRERSFRQSARGSLHRVRPVLCGARTRTAERANQTANRIGGACIRTSERADPAAGWPDGTGLLRSVPALVAGANRAADRLRRTSLRCVAAWTRVGHRCVSMRRGLGAGVHLVCTNAARPGRTGTPGVYQCGAAWTHGDTWCVPMRRGLDARGHRACTNAARPGRTGTPGVYQCGAAWTHVDTGRVPMRRGLDARGHRACTNATRPGRTCTTRFAAGTSQRRTRGAAAALGRRKGHASNDLVSPSKMFTRQATALIGDSKRLTHLIHIPAAEAAAAPQIVAFVSAAEGGRRSTSHPVEIDAHRNGSSLNPLPKKPSFPVRLTVGERLLLETPSYMREIALHAGFGTISTLYRCFKQRTAWRRELFGRSENEKHESSWGGRPRDRRGTSGIPLARSFALDRWFEGGMARLSCGLPCDGGLLRPRAGAGAGWDAR